MKSTAFLVKRSSQVLNGIVSLSGRVGEQYLSEFRRASFDVYLMSELGLCIVD